jgi:HEAT repeat protein
MADVLAARDGGRLTDFARTFKAAARAVVLYPDDHPAIGSTLQRLAQMTAQSALRDTLRLTVSADTLLLDGAAAAKPDPAVRELAALLHAHAVAAVAVRPGTDLDTWRRFLRLLGRAPDDVRAGGGIAQLWSAEGATSIAITEIDYAGVLAERDGLPASWQEAVRRCLAGDGLSSASELLDAILQSEDVDEALQRLLQAVVEAAEAEGRDASGGAAALVSLLRALVAAAHAQPAEREATILRDLAIAVGRMPPDTLVALLEQRDRDEDPAARHAVDTVVSAMPDGIVASFVAHHAVGADAPLDRVAQAFQALVVDPDRRERLVAMAHDTAIVSGAEGAGFEESWQAVAQRLLSQYSDEPFVSSQYARELTSVRTGAVRVEQLQDDPPERIAAWLDTVSSSELRRLDVMLVTDLLRLELDAERRTRLMDAVVSLVEDLLLVGDIDAAGEVVALLAADLQSDRLQERRQLARDTLDRLVSAEVLQRVIAQIQVADDRQFATLKAICTAAGERMIPLLATAIADDERPRIRERLIELLIAFGAIGRRQTDQLRSASNPEVRRAAVYLLRELGGPDALAELSTLMHDPDPAVQRDAVKAMLTFGSADARAILERSLASGTPAAREAIMQAVATVRDRRATPLLVYVLGLGTRRDRGSLYMRALDLLAQLRDPDSVPALRTALYRGEWWAPRRTARRRAAAAAALARIGDDAARAVLTEAAASAPRSARAAARAVLGSMDEDGRADMQP